MNKLKFYLWNVFFSSLIGLAVFIFSLLFWVWYYSFPKMFISILHNPVGLFYALIYDMSIGAIIGTISLFFIFQIFLRFTQRPLIGFLSNFVVVAVLNIVGAISLAGVRNFQQFVPSGWFLALIVSEVLSLFLISAWYRRLMFYKAKLEQKKATLHNQGDF
jgi:hypothetical protein